MALCLSGYISAIFIHFVSLGIQNCLPSLTSHPNRWANKKAGFPLTRKARFMLCKAGRNARPASAHYFAAPPSNHAAIFIRSSSVMCVTLPSGIAFNVTAC
jgi:hypothetical protein